MAYKKYKDQHTPWKHDHSCVFNRSEILDIIHDCDALGEEEYQHWWRGIRADAQDNPRNNIKVILDRTHTQLIKMVQGND